MSVNSTSPPIAIATGRSPAPKSVRITAALATPAMSCMRLQLSSASSVGGFVVRLRLRVMLTTTTLDDIAILNPRRNAPSGAMPSARNVPPPTTVPNRISAGDAHKTDRCSRLTRRRSSSMPTSKSRSTTPKSASKAICASSATNPGVNGETSRPTTRYPTIAGNRNLRATYPNTAARNNTTEMSNTYGAVLIIASMPTPLGNPTRCDQPSWPSNSCIRVISACCVSTICSPSMRTSSLSEASTICAMSIAPS